MVFKLPNGPRGCHACTWGQQHHRPLQPLLLLLQHDATSRCKRRRPPSPRPRLPLCIRVTGNERLRHNTLHGTLRLPAAHTKWAPHALQLHDLLGAAGGSHTNRPNSSSRMHLPENGEAAAIAPSPCPLRRHAAAQPQPPRTWPGRQPGGRGGRPGERPCQALQRRGLGGVGSSSLSSLRMTLLLALRGSPERTTTCCTCGSGVGGGEGWGEGGLSVSSGGRAGGVGVWLCGCVCGVAGGRAGTQDWLWLCPVTIKLPNIQATQTSYTHTLRVGRQVGR